MKDRPDKGTMILQRAWQKCTDKEHNKAGFFGGEGSPLFLSYRSMCRMPSTAALAARALVCCLSPSQNMNVHSSAALHSSRNGIV